MHGPWVRALKLVMRSAPGLASCALHRWGQQHRPPTYLVPTSAWLQQARIASRRCRPCRRSAPHRMHAWRRVPLGASAMLLPGAGKPWAAHAACRGVRACETMLPRHSSDAGAHATGKLQAVSQAARRPGEDGRTCLRTPSTSTFTFTIRTTRIVRTHGRSTRPAGLLPRPHGVHGGNRKMDPGRGTPSSPAAAQHHKTIHTDIGQLALDDQPTAAAQWPEHAAVAAVRCEHTRNAGPQHMHTHSANGLELGVCTPAQLIQSTCVRCHTYVPWPIQHAPALPHGGTCTAMGTCAGCTLSEAVRTTCSAGMHHKRLHWHTQGPADCVPVTYDMQCRHYRHAPYQKAQQKLSAVGPHRCRAYRACRVTMHGHLSSVRRHTFVPCFCPASRRRVPCIPVLNMHPAAECQCRTYDVQCRHAPYARPG